MNDGTDKERKPRGGGAKCSLIRDNSIILSDRHFSRDHFRSYAQRDNNEKWRIRFLIYYPNYPNYFNYPSTPFPQFVRFYFSNSQFGIGFLICLSAPTVSVRQFSAPSPADFAPPSLPPGGRRRRRFAIARQLAQRRTAHRKRQPAKRATFCGCCCFAAVVV